MTQHTNTSLFRTCRWWPGGLAVVLCLVSIWASECQGQQVLEPSAASAEGVLPESQEPIVPLPLHVPADPAKVALGERLFHDVRLSGGNAIACATCHRLEHGGTDGLPRAMATTGTLHLRNTPTIFNVAFNAAYNWDGGVRTLEAHAERVLLSPALMHTTWPVLLARLRTEPDYRDRVYDSVPWAPDTGPCPGRPGDLHALPDNAELSLRSLPPEPSRGPER